MPPERRWSYDVRATTTVGVDALWPLVGEARRWKDWAGFTSSTLLEEGTPEPDGVGALRHFAVGPGGSRERVLEWEPPHHLAYTIERGYPVRDYRSDVELTALGDGGTAIRWHGTFDAKVPGSGHVMQAVTRAMMARFAKRLVAYAERRPKG
ncbi:MAG TPA: SRPBCC family protein [Acidimicrobiales bacterium]|nr:SRPBCC family protein [Acidimicrobiales bacterium]